MAAPLIVILLLVLLILTIWFSGKFSSLAQDQNVANVRLARLEAELAKLRSAPRIEPATTNPAPPVSAPEVASVPPVLTTPVIVQAQEVGTTATISAPPILPPVPPATARITPRLKPAVNWEQFMGAKLFAWLGGFAGFLAVAFFVKYSFEHDLIPPEVRVAIGYLLSAGLLAGGVLITREKFRVTSQVLCATGVVSLYAVAFASHAVYHFAFFGPVVTFALMTLITAAAFLLAVRLNAQVVALLGLFGGFLTPVLLSTGQDNPGALFGFVALLDAGLIAVALRRHWFYLVLMAAAGTIVMQIGWTEKFFTAAKAPIVVTFGLGFAALFFAGAEISRRLRRPAVYVTGSAVVLPLVALGFALFLLGYSDIADQPALFLAFVFAADLFLLALTWRDSLAPRAHLLGGASAFLVLAVWTGTHLSNATLPWGLGAYLVFAVMHTAFPLVLARVRPSAVQPFWSQLAPPIALLLVLGSVLRFDEISFLIWPAILVVDVIAVVLALRSASLVALASVLVLTLGTTAVCIFRVPADAELPPMLLIMLVAFPIFFFTAGVFVARRLGGDSGATQDSTSSWFGDAHAQIPAFAALLPFVLLILMSQRLHLTSPATLFGLALLLNVLALGLSRLLVIEWLPLCALIGTAVLEYAWHSRLFSTIAPTTPLLWYIGFYLLYSVFPFLFRRVFLRQTGPWAVAALAGLPQFWLVYDVVRRAWPSDFPGVVPALFALAPLASLMAIVRTTSHDSATRLNQLAWLGGAALFFITLIFPIQFERQWITLGWALEGCALLWLFHRVPHPGLRATGVVLLTAAFARLAVNPAVLAYHARTDTAVFNWYLYAYGLVAVCLFLAARLLAPPRERVLAINGPALLNTLATVLTFLLLNIEIADYFSRPGSILTFQFSGSFARDMAYTIAWALFALVLLSAGIWRVSKAARYAALALLSVTLLKLFFHDLAQLAQLYRVGALIAVAAVAIVASFLYQRFAPNDALPPSES
jgi:uncharacterized membrane protein